MPIYVLTHWINPPTIDNKRVTISHNFNRPKTHHISHESENFLIFRLFISKFMVVSNWVKKMYVQNFDDSEYFCLDSSLVWDLLFTRIFFVWLVIWRKVNWARGFIGVKEIGSMELTEEWAGRRCNFLNGFLGNFDISGSFLFPFC
jgi:hypothetical protein